jgi:hypothetical protein
MDAVLRSHLRARESYVSGEPIIIGFTVENLSSMDVWILKWYTPLEGIKGKILEVKCDGVDVPYEGMLMKRGNPETDDYVRLRRAESAGGEFDLSSAYSLPACKVCSVKFKGRIYDVVLKQREVPRAADQHRSIDAPGNTVVFSITRG